MNLKKYQIIGRNSGECPPGTVCYEFMGGDYGFASEDTLDTGVEHISVTLDPNGGTPSFTAPVTSLQEIHEHRIGRTFVPPKSFLSLAEALDYSHPIVFLRKVYEPLVWAEFADLIHNACRLDVARAVNSVSDKKLDGFLLTLGNEGRRLLDVAKSTRAAAAAAPPTNIHETISRLMHLGNIKPGDVWPDFLIGINAWGPPLSALCKRAAEQMTEMADIIGRGGAEGGNTMEAAVVVLKRELETKMKDAAKCDEQMAKIKSHIVDIEQKQELGRRAIKDIADAIMVLEAGCCLTKPEQEKIIGSIQADPYSRPLPGEVE